jgi:hypothetical protein
MGISTDEWLNELNRISQLHADGLTSFEIAQGLGLSHGVARDRIRAWVQAGVLKFTGHKTVTRIDGQTGKAPAYAPVELDRKKAKAHLN